MSDSVLITSRSLPLNIIKRDGTKITFDGDRIRYAIQRAGEDTGEFGVEETNLLTGQVLKVLGYRFANLEPTVEQIQDVVEQVLISSNHFKTAKSYIIYRENRAKLRGQKHAMIDVISSIDEYLNRKDWRINANANQGYSLGGLILNMSGKMIANYWLSNIYPEKIGEAHRNGDFYIHDLDMLSGYCAGWSLRTLLVEGFNGVGGKVESTPPKHLVTALGQMVNFLGTLQNEWAGAQAFSSFDTYLAPYIRVDNLSYEEVKQHIQSFIYNLNVPSRWGTQTPFTNLTFDIVCPEDIKKDRPIIGGKEVDFCYGDLQKEMDMINRAYMENMIAGDKNGRVFTFPIPTYNITKDFDWDAENTDLLFEMTSKYGLPYFQNFINSDLSPHMIRSMCCRLQLDLTELLKRGNGLFGSAEQTGSIGVVTINCARLGYLYKGNYSALITKLDVLLDYAKQSLELKRKTIQQYMDNGLYPYTKRYLGSLRNHFSTIGVNGMNEMVRNFTNNSLDIACEDGRKMALDVLDHIREKLVEFQAVTGHMYNLEATPAEGATYRLAKEDKKRYPDIIQAGTNEAPYYTNSSQLPVGFSDDIFKALQLQEPLQQKYTGGTVIHIYMNESFEDFKMCKKLVKKVLENFKIPYITITPTFSICPKHGYLKGEQKFCPICDEELIQKKLEQQCACSK